MAFSSPTNAETFTLLELSQGTSFTIGNLEFFDWQVTETTADTSIITVATVDSELLPGFQDNANGELSLPGPEAGLERIVYTFSVATIDQQPLIEGALLSATDFNVMPEAGQTSSEIEIAAAQLGAIELGVLLTDNAGNAANAGSLDPPLDLLTMDSVVEVRLAGPEDAGPATLNSYALLFSVPEPSRSVLGLAALLALAAIRAARRGASSFLPVGERNF
jgi:hypothetical protein